MFEKIKGYISYYVLFGIICVLLSSVSYSSLNGSAKTKVFLNNELINLQNGLKYIDDNIYVAYSDVEQVITSDIFKESALKKVIITANNKIMTYTLNASEYYINYEVHESQGAKKYVSYENMEYILLDELCSIYDYSSIVDERLNIVNIVENDYEVTTLRNTREYGYLHQNNKSSRVLIGENVKLSIVKDASYYGTDSEMVAVIVEDKESKSLLYIAKQNLNFEFNVKEEKEDEYVFKTIVQNEDNIKVEENGDNSYIYSAFKLVSNSGDITDICDLNVIGTNSYAMITNGYKASNYDNSITNYVLQNIDARQKVILTVSDKIKDTDIKGVVVNFRDFKVTSKEYFTQFIKEFSMYLHSIDKEIIVYIPLNASYIDEKAVFKYVDNCIFIMYGTKSENSKTSGSDSSVNFVENSIKSLVQNNEYANKIIIEIPLFSLLWTEKEQKVLSVQYMYNSAIKDYIEKNNLTPVLNEQTGQMYVEHTKGSLTYKMWLEDEYSINKKISIAKENNLAGVVLYKKGYEAKDLKIN